MHMRRHTHGLTGSTPYMRDVSEMRRGDAELPTDPRDPPGIDTRNLRRNYFTKHISTFTLPLEPVSSYVCLRINTQKHSAKDTTWQIHTRDDINRPNQHARYNQQGR